MPLLALGAAGAAAGCQSIKGSEQPKNPNLHEDRATAFPAFVVSEYFGGTLGNGDDQECIQRTLNAANESGGGQVVLPPRSDQYAYKYSQLTIPRWVLLSGVGWYTFGASGAIARMEQLAGVNDDSVVFSDNGEDESSRPFIGPFGITDLAMRAASNSTSGNGISFRVEDGRIGLIQDMTTLERLVLRGFPGSGIYARSGSPLRLDYITTLWNGRYGIEVEDTHVDTNNGSVHQLSMNHISGDGNMGGAPDGGGATVLLKGLMAHKSAVSLVDIKSEYRIRPTSDSGDGTVMGNYHAVLIEDCACPISVTAVEHLATGSQNRRPGNAIQVRGPARPDLTWQSVTVRDDHESQTIGGLPLRVFDEVLERGSGAPHGAIGPSIESYISDQAAVQVDTDRRDELLIGESTILRRSTSSSEPILRDSSLQLTYFTARKSENIMQVRTCTGAVAGVGAALCRIGVYEVDELGDLTLIASSENATELWSASGTTFTSALGVGFFKRRGVRYAIAQLSVGGGTLPSLVGQIFPSADEAAQPPRLCGAVDGYTDLPQKIPAESVVGNASQVYAALIP